MIDSPPKERRKAFTDLMACQCWDKVELLLRDGRSTPFIARFMHAQGEMLQIKHTSLMRKLRLYREKVVYPSDTKSLIDSMMKNRSLDIDNLEELTKIILIQKSRVEKDLELEDKMPKTMSSLTKELVILFDLIERREKIMQESGVSPRVPQKHLVGIGVMSNPWDKMLNELSDEQRAEMRRAIQEDYSEQKKVLEAPYRKIAENGDDDLR